MIEISMATMRAFLSAGLMVKIVRYTYDTHMKINGALILFNKGEPT